jgi:hypothetical protein
MNKEQAKKWGQDKNPAPFKIQYPMKNQGKSKALLLHLRLYY